MSVPYSIKVQSMDEGDFIYFANNTKEFVEVVFVVNGREVRAGKLYVEGVKGFGYAPKLEKPVRKDREGNFIPLKKGDAVRAMVYRGEGSYKDEDLEKPTFLRHRLIDKFSFKRTSDEPVEILEMMV